MWTEDLNFEFLAGEECQMKDPDGVAALLDYKLYHQHWSWEGPEGETCGIPEAELKASSVHLRVGNTNKRKHVLLHKRRVNESGHGRGARVCLSRLLRRFLEATSSDV